ncbi:MAG: hypothetical protein JO352_03675 [Chloroflexi bacterium]|nr:hypothetical protein [Chloroflexota bacterium]MBV9602677.1 hypothetical protein [Chloroflexota bacterium]
MSVELGIQPRVFALSELFGVLDVPGPDLLLRAYGEQALPVLEAKLLGVPEGRALVLSFAGVRIMTPSFADATIVALLRGLREGRYEERYLLLAEPNEETLVGLAGTFERRLHRSLKLAIVLRCAGTYRLFGPVEQNLQAAWQLVAERGTLTARELADELELEINTASMRLWKLHSLGLLARREEALPNGRQHIYTLPA